MNTSARTTDFDRTVDARTTDTSTTDCGRTVDTEEPKVFLGVDVGGTFTDVVSWDSEKLSVSKVSSTPEDQSDAVIAGARAILPPGCSASLMHGTTVATNALLERRGAKTLMVTDKRFESLIEIARQDRPSLYDPFADRVPPLVDEHLRIGVETSSFVNTPSTSTSAMSARPSTSAHTNVGLANMVAAVDEVAAIVVENQVSSVAVCFLYSYAEPELEKVFSELLRDRLAGMPDVHIHTPTLDIITTTDTAPKLDALTLDTTLMSDAPTPNTAPTPTSGTSGASYVSVSASVDVVAEFREYERFSTTVVNAFLVPEVSRYMDGLDKRAKNMRRTNSGVMNVNASGIDDISVMRSSGGLVSVGYASTIPASILLSGPAGGVMASAALAQQMGVSSAVTFDMGGTSTDVCRVLDGRPEVVYKSEIAGYACLMPSVAVHTVGAGGGSVAWADSGKALRVGPRSAGAVPGPACYGRKGTEPTVTDANLVLGRLNPNVKLAGSVELRSDLAWQAIGRLGDSLGLSPVDTALGVVAVVDSHMIHAIRAVSVEQGTDVRESVLIAFGGAGGSHASALARALGMRSVVIPLNAGVFSAFGLLLSPPRADATKTVNIRSSEKHLLPSTAKQVLVSALHKLESDSGRQAFASSLFVDMRYVGQAHETSVPYELDESWGSLCAKFHKLHSIRNGFSNEFAPVEAVTVHAEAVGVPVLASNSAQPSSTQTSFKQPSSQENSHCNSRRNSRRKVIMADGVAEADVWWRPALKPYDVVYGPAILEETDSTTYLAAGERGLVNDHGAVEITW